MDTEAKPLSAYPPLTTEQLADRWNINVSTLEVWRQRGKGPKFTKIGEGVQANVVYPFDEVVAYEQAGKRQSTRAAKEGDENGKE